MRNARKEINKQLTIPTYHMSRDIKVCVLKGKEDAEGNIHHDTIAADKRDSDSDCQKEKQGRK
jgi:hypothetical protein